MFLLLLERESGMSEHRRLVGPRKVSSAGQIALPRDVLRSLGIVAGRDRLHIFVDGQRVLLVSEEDLPAALAEIRGHPS